MDKSKVVSLLANYTHNPFCPQDRIDFLEGLKLSDPNRYRVDGQGEWGEPLNDEPFMRNYNDDHNFTAEEFPFYTNYPIWLSFDFNYDPCCATVYQEVDDYGIYAMREFSVTGGTRALCQQIKTSDVMTVPTMIWSVTGDNSGSSSSSTSGNVTDYDIIQDEFKLRDDQLVRVDGRNKSHTYRRHLCNEFFYNCKSFWLDKSMLGLRRDLLTAKPDKNGKLYKNRDKGHAMDLLDTFRYFIDARFYRGLEDIRIFADSCQQNLPKEA